MSRLCDTGERLVAAATPRFKDFRVDFERISTAASKASREGRDGLSPDDAIHFFGDVEWHLRTPLQRRYVEAGAIDPVAHYHAKRFKLLLGRNEPWPDAPAADALRLFAAHGRADVGVALIRAYVDMQHNRLKRDYSTRNPRAARVERGAGVEQAIASVTRAIAGAIPDRKAGLVKDLAAVEPYLDRHGAEADRAWLEDTRRTLWMEKRA